MLSNFPNFGGSISVLPVLKSYGVDKSVWFTKFIHLFIHSKFNKNRQNAVTQ